MIFRLFISQQYALHTLHIIKKDNKVNIEENIYQKLTPLHGILKDIAQASILARSPFP